jgi:hypothetical protein
MSAISRFMLIVVIAAGVVLLQGCPGMPGAAGGKQTTPPGVQPPPGLESGGAYTLMGTTITPPDGYLLLVEYASREPGAQPVWRSCRRIVVLDSSLLIEGLNYDGRDEKAQRDVNEVVPFTKIMNAHWKYEAKPMPEPEVESEAGKSEGKD